MNKIWHIYLYLQCKLCLGKMFICCFKAIPQTKSFYLWMLPKYVAFDMEELDMLIIHLKWWSLKSMSFVFCFFNEYLWIFVCAIPLQPLTSYFLLESSSSPSPPLPSIPSYLTCTLFFDPHVDKDCISCLLCDLTVASWTLQFLWAHSRLLWMMVAMTHFCPFHSN